MMWKLGALPCAVAVLLLGAVAQDPPAKEPETPVVVETDETAEPPAESAEPASRDAGDDVQKLVDYDVALAEGFQHAAEDRLDDALAAFERARAADDTPVVRKEIEKLKAKQAKREAADRTAENIQAVIDEGRLEEAESLAGSAVEQFADDDQAERFVTLRRQVDALSASTGKRARWQDDAEAADKALAGRNLRAGVLALERAVRNGGDDAVRQKHEKFREALETYDRQRAKAADLRRDSANLEEAVAALQEAAKAWNTEQIQQEIEEAQLALQARRDRISSVDFEERGDAAGQGLGRSLAEEVLPAFKSRFDPVERQRLAEVLAQLEVGGDRVVADPQTRARVGQLAKVRYVVVGSVSKFRNYVVQARLIDAATGLVVQSASMVGETPEDLIDRAPQLARLLLMGDEQKIAYERRLAAQAEADRRAKEEAEAAERAAVAKQAERQTVVTRYQPPPAPELPPLERAPPPPVVAAVSAPAAGGLTYAQLAALRTMQPVEAEPVVLVRQGLQLREKAVQVAVEVGDNLFLRRRFAEALRHFEFAAQCFPDSMEIRLRLERCRPFVQPALQPAVQPAVVTTIVNAPPVAAPPPPTVAILHFVEAGDPYLVPPGIGAWAADAVTPYLASHYPVADFREVFWYMSRMGLTMRDVVQSPAARVCLARPLNIRYFVVGSLRAVAVRPWGRGVEAAANLIDAETGALVASTRVLARDARDLKLQLCDLAHGLVHRTQPIVPPTVVVATPAPVQVPPPSVEIQFQQLLQRAEGHCARKEFDLAVNLCLEAGKLRPNSVKVQFLLNLARSRQRSGAALAVAVAKPPAPQPVFVAQPNRQWELAAAAEAARLRAEQEAAARAAADRAAHERQRETAFLNLVAQARECRTQRNPVRAVSFYESAFAMRRTAELERELAAARAEVEAAKQQALVAERRRRSEAEAARQAAAVAAARAELEKQKAAQFAAEQARRAAEAEQLAAQIARLRDRAARQQASGQWDAALASLQSARRLQPSKELDAQIDAVQTSLAQAAAAQKGAEERERLAKRLAAEKAAREQAERTATELRQRYDALVKQAETDLAGDRPEAALAGFRNAKKLLAGPEAETGESRAAARLAARRNQANVEAARERQRARLAKLKQTTEQKLKAGDVNAAHAAATEAAKLAPQEPDAQAMTLAVQKAKAESMKQAVAKQQSDARQADFERLLSAGKASLSAKQFSPAVASLTAAAAIDPRHRETQTLLAQAKQGMQSSAKNAEEEKRLAQFRAKLMQGQAALKAKNSKAAAEIFADAQKLYPQDAGVARLLAEAKSAQAAMDKDAERIKQFNQHFAAAQTALSASKLKEAKAAADKAVALAPNYAPAKKLAADVQQALAAADAKVKKSEPPPKKAPPKPAVKSGKPK